ncbi:MAG: hypothetical protein AAF558_07850 [Verrucomicrobiota bacterium]
MPLFESISGIKSLAKIFITLQSIWLFPAAGWSHPAGPVHLHGHTESGASHVAIHSIEALIVLGLLITSALVIYYSLPKRQAAKQKKK